MQNKILELVKSEGPLLPVSVAGKLSIDSFVASAYLSQLAEAGQIKVSKEKVGGNFLYYFSGQESKVGLRISELTGAKKTAGNYATKPLDPNKDKDRQAFKERLAEIEVREEKEKRQKADFLQQIKSAIAETVAGKKEEPKRPEIVQQVLSREQMPLPASRQPPTVARQQPPAASHQQPAIKKERKEKPKEPEEYSKVIDSALAYLVDRQADILSKEIVNKGKDANIVAVVTSAIGPMKVFVKVKSKKRISEADLAHAYTAGTHRKLPVLLFTDGNLSKNAEKYLSGISGLLKIRKV